MPRQGVRLYISLLLSAMTLTLPATPAAATGKPVRNVIVLPGATSAEGIAKGRGHTFYAGDLFLGDIYRGDVARGTAELFVDAPDGRMALGMYADNRRGWLFVAGARGWAYVYDTRTGATVAAIPLGDPATSLINDVFVTPRGAFFTDSWRPFLYFVPISPSGRFGSPRTIAVTGPAADTSGEFNLNGIVLPDGSRTLIVSHTAHGKLYRIDPVTGASRAIAGVDVPRVDGIVLEGRRIWAVQNFVNQVSRIRLNPAMTAGVVEDVITDENFQVPATAVRFGRHLAVVNAKFDTGVPPTADRFEVVIVRR